MLAIESNGRHSYSNNINMIRITMRSNQINELSQSNQMAISFA